MRNGRTHAFPARRSSDLPRAERQLAEGPIALDPRTVPAADATRRAASVLAAAAAALDLLVEEGAILSEALGVEVSDLPFERLHALAAAVVGLAAAPKPQARWASPAAAAAAEVALEVGAQIGRASCRERVCQYV